MAIKISKAFKERMADIIVSPYCPLSIVALGMVGFIFFMLNGQPLR